MVSRSHFLTAEQLLESDRFVLFRHNEVVARGDKFVWNRLEIASHLPADYELHLVQTGANTIVAARVAEDAVTALEAETRSLRSLLFAEGDYPFAVAGKASQIIDWYSSHRFCGACGEPTRQHQTERAVFCPACQRQFYPRINPCVIVLVVRGRTMLLARSARFRSNFFSCLAGFIEVGETAEQTIHREVKEEAGVEVENIRYLRSQSWPFPSQLMLGFLADYKSGDIVPEPGEIEEANWYDVDDLPNVPAAGISVAGELIQHHVDLVKRGEL